MRLSFTRFQSFKLNLLAILVGILAGYGAILFRGLIGFIQNISFHNSIDFHLASPLTNSHGIWVIFLPSIGLLLSHLIVSNFAREAKGHGVPEVMEAILMRGGKMRKRLVAVKALASAITIGSGGSVGREGPIVQIGSAGASTLGQIFKLGKSDMKVIVGCGTAGAVAATFNTPIAGVIFAIELIVLEFKSKSFIPLVISAVFATIISRIHVGNTPAFIVPAHSLQSPAELAFYLLLGVLCGLIGYLVIRSVYFTEDVIGKIKLPFFLKAIIGGLIIGIAGYHFPQIFGVGYEAIDQVLHEELSINFLVSLIFLKILMSSITLGAGGSGGVFAPSLFIGAMTGGAFGFIIHQIFPDMTASYGAYALVGMAAVFSSTSRATFSAIVILFEMTRDYSIILPLMFACVIADQVAHMIAGDDTIYSVKLKRKGLFFIEGFEVNILKITPVKEIMTSNVDTLLNTITLKEAYQTVLNTSHVVYPVVNEYGTALGTISAKDIIRDHNNVEEGALVSSMIKNSPQVFPNETAFSALKKLDNERDPRILVVDPKDRKLVGIVCPRDFVCLTRDEC